MRFRIHPVRIPFAFCIQYPVFFSLNSMLFVTFYHSELSLNRNFLLLVYFILELFGIRTMFLILFSWNCIRSVLFIPDFYEYWILVFLWLVYLLIIIYIFLLLSYFSLVVVIMPSFSTSDSFNSWFFACWLTFWTLEFWLYAYFLTTKITLSFQF